MTNTDTTSYLLVATAETGAVLAVHKVASLDEAWSYLNSALTHPEEDPGVTADVIAEAWTDAQEIPEYFAVRRRTVRWGIVRL